MKNSISLLAVAALVLILGFFGIVTLLKVEHLLEKKVKLLNPIEDQFNS